MAAAKTGYVMHVVSNTHWDREWTTTFQENRLMLADYLEQLMNLFDTNADYKYFHLDSQTIPLEDFASVKPEAAERLKKYIKKGRLFVGPWYTLPEMNLLDGESIVRNLVAGHKVAQEYGGVMKVGYTPTSNGQISQLPQIYDGFGIDSMLFYRGINADVAKKEFYWKGADGTTSLVVQFPDGRAVFWGFGALPVFYNMWPFEPESWKYRWSRPGTPFRMDNEQQYTIIEMPDLYNQESVEPALTETRKWEIKDVTTRHLVYLDGMDQSPPYRNIPRLIKDANRIFKGDKMVHDSLPATMSAIKKEVKNLKTLSGEMRFTNKSGRKGFCYLHPGILSTRMYLKQQNRISEYKLFRWAEPIASVAWLLGFEYPGTFLEQGLKMLLANHAHDDICGCSIDKVHKDMMYRFSEVSTLADAITRTSLQKIVPLIDTSSYPEQSILINLFNSQAFDRKETVKIAVDLPQESEIKDFLFEDSAGNTVDFQPVSHEDLDIAVPHDGSTRRFPACRVHGFLSASVPSMGYETLRLVEKRTPKKGTPVASSPTTLENKFFKIKIHPNGSFDVYNKKTRQTFKELHVFEDNGERGNAWIIHAPANDTVISSRTSTAKIKLLANGPISAQVRIQIPMRLPKGLTADFENRTSATKNTVITSILTLGAESKSIRLETSLDNQVESHRLRVLFPTDIATDYSLAEMPFDITKRSIKLPEDKEKWVDTPSPNFPQVNFACAVNGSRGLAILNEGLTDYEVRDDKRRTFALTLLRTFFQGSLWSTSRWPDEGYQCKGLHTFRYAIMPFSRDPIEGGVVQEAYAHNVPLRVVQTRPLKGKYPMRASFVRLDSNQVVISSMKQSENGSELVIRVSNLGTKTVRTRLETAWPIKTARLTNMNEETIRKMKAAKNAVDLELKGKKVVTVAIKLDKKPSL